MIEVRFYPLSMTIRLLKLRSSAIRQTLHFYPAHLQQSSHNPPQLVLLTDDRRNREIAHSENLLAVSARDYVDGLLADVRQGLVDLVVGGVDEVEPGERRARRIYEEVGVIVQGLLPSVKRASP